MAFFFFFLFFYRLRDCQGTHQSPVGVLLRLSPPCLLPDPIGLPLVSTGLLTSGSWTSAAPVIKEQWSDIHPRLSSSRRLSALTLFLPTPTPTAFPNPLHLHHRLLLVHALYFSVHSPGEALEIAALPQKPPKHSPTPALLTHRPQAAQTRCAISIGGPWLDKKRKEKKKGQSA